MAKKVGVVLIMSFIFMMMLVPAAGAADPDIPEQVLAVARESLEVVQNKIAANPEMYGFSDVAEVKKLVLGAGFRYNYINYTEEGEIPTSNNTSFLQILRPQEEIMELWLFPLYVEGNGKTFLTVGFDQTNGKYTLFGFGGDAADFTTSLDNFWDFCSKKGVNPQPTLVVDRLHDYMLVGEIDGEELVFPAAKNTPTGVPATEVIQRIQNRYEYIKTLPPGSRGSVGIFDDMFAPETGTQPFPYLLALILLISAVVIFVKLLIPRFMAR